MSQPRAVLRLALAAMLLAPIPAQAQMSQGYKFLEAIKKKDVEVINKMVSSSGAKTTAGDIIINTRDITSGDTALHIMIGKGELAWVNFLIQRGADVNLKNFSGTTPLWLAINTGFTDAAIVLVAKGARVNDPGPAGETPIIAAVHRKNLDLARILIASGADPTKADNSGRTAVDYATLNGKGALLDEITAAAAKAKAKKVKSYGPSL